MLYNHHAKSFSLMYWSLPRPLPLPWTDATERIHKLNMLLPVLQADVEQKVHDLDVMKTECAAQKYAITSCLASISTKVAARDMFPGGLIVVWSLCVHTCLQTERSSGPRPPC